MKTKGRRMQAKSVCDVSAKPLAALEQMNLGESVRLSLEEQRAYRVRDTDGRTVRDVFGSPQDSRVLRFGKRSMMLASVEDAGSVLGCWRQLNLLMDRQWTLLPMLKLFQSWRIVLLFCIRLCLL